MKRNPLWVLVVWISGFLVLVMCIPFLVEEPHPLKFIAIGIAGYVLILVYAIGRINGEMNQKYENLNDRDKLLDLLEDQLDLKKSASYCVHRAQKNIEKIQGLFTKEKEAQQVIQPDNAQ